MEKKIWTISLIFLFIISLVACQNKEEVYVSKRTRPVDSVFNSLDENESDTEQEEVDPRDFKSGGYVLKGELSIRQKTEPGAQVLYKAQAGETVELIEAYEDYLELSYQGAIGFVPKDDFILAVEGANNVTDEGEINNPVTEPDNI